MAGNMRHKLTTTRSAHVGSRYRAIAFCDSGTMRYWQIRKQWHRLYSTPWRKLADPPPQSSPARGEEVFRSHLKNAYKDLYYCDLSGTFISVHAEVNRCHDAKN